MFLHRKLARFVLFSAVHNFHECFLFNLHDKTYHTYTHTHMKLSKTEIFQELDLYLCQLATTFQSNLDSFQGLFAQTIIHKFYKRLALGKNIHPPTKIRENKEHLTGPV
ncbi:hypothetical protein OIU74_018065 [Salix koriyanagi]|uniref:Uncharacterized protein n=1 Tax=Salix koriyanagi TaxID=2511006 RepID=A0A9Q1AHU7_9ROSI|nr:hypothetical protein OIU74_018065 [Salix koriyanagi]